jgi:hypothetical protein
MYQTQRHYNHMSHHHKWSTLQIQGDIIWPQEQNHHQHQEYQMHQDLTNVMNHVVYERKWENKIKYGINKISDRQTGYSC